MALSVSASEYGIGDLMLEPGVGLNCGLGSLFISIPCATLSWRMEQRQFGWEISKMLTPAGTSIPLISAHRGQQAMFPTKMYLVAVGSCKFSAMPVSGFGSPCAPASPRSTAVLVEGPTSAPAWSAASPHPTPPSTILCERPRRTPGLKSSPSTILCERPRRTPGLKSSPLVFISCNIPGEVIAISVPLLYAPNRIRFQSVEVFVASDEGFLVPGASIARYFTPIKKIFLRERTEADVQFGVRKAPVLLLPLDSVKEFLLVPSQGSLHPAKYAVCDERKGGFLALRSP